MCNFRSFISVLCSVVATVSVFAQTAGGGTVVRDVSIQSTVLGREMLYSVYLPAGYTSSKQYPVLYLLHGYGGDQNDWWVFDDMADIITSYSPSELPGITLECGDRDYFTYDNREFSALLTRLGINHEHIERSGR